MESLLHGNEFIATLIFFLICFLQPILLPIPEAATVTAGSAILGAFPAACISFAGTLSGIIVMYFIAKIGGQKLIRKFVKEKQIQQYERYVSKNETSILLILFIIPILPDEIICVGAGLGGVNIKKFVIIAAISKILTSFSLAYSLDFAQSMSLTNSQLLLFIIGIASIIMLTSILRNKLLLKGSRSK
ncbi:VTT domain-containing protein [Bacillus luteolus]|uniref:VTT domain-containing protein n=1 Tax=Litchfieldia luteola TaxID=682179 RepID=A0ABR9QDG7_9BACI|nr:VTT domain-containing protein [Cytobacillus luteolus]MBE4906531.1 VTT domain-containing protein [Cytobacillus luteolus]MBP1941215.1 putative membrane protein YdjX (TVP38/TMEM64 family) [Cytobacillus luteolus]